MNKIYRLVWSRKEQAPVVASELATRQGKAGGAGRDMVAAPGDAAVAARSHAPPGGARFSGVSLLMLVAAASIHGFAEAGNGGLQLCAAQGTGNGTSYGPKSSASLNCGTDPAYAFGLFNNTSDSGAGAGSSTVRIYGYNDGRLELRGDSGIIMNGVSSFLQNADFNGHLINNLAAGFADTDAVNVSQLKSVISGFGGGASFDTTTGMMTAPSYSVGGTNVNNVGDALTNLDGRTTQNSTDITALGDQIADGTIGLVQQDATSRGLTVGAATDGTSVDFTGTDGARVLTGVDAGEVSATSTDAINGSQLNATNLAIGALDVATDALGAGVASSLGGGAAYNAATGALTAPSYSVGGTTYNNVGDALGNLDGRTTQNSTDITALGDQLADGTIGLVQQDVTSRGLTVGATTDGTSVDFTGTDGARVLTGVDAGEVSATSTDAINGSQLNATNLAIGALDVATDALGAGVASSLGGGAAYNAATGALTAPSYSVGGTSVDNVGDALINLDGRTTQNTSDITALGDQLADGTIGLVQQDATSRGLTVGATTDGTSVDFTGTDGARVLTGIGTGAISATSTDAINGSQLHAANTSLANTLGGGAAVNADGTVSAPSYQIGGNTYNNVGAALGGVDTALTNLASGGGIKYFHANSALADATAIGTDSVAVGPQANAASTDSVAMGRGAVAGTAADTGTDPVTPARTGATAIGTLASATGSNATALGNAATAAQDGAVALGNSSTTAAAVATASGTIAGTSYSYAGTAPASTVSIGAAGNERTLTNLAAGRVSTTSTDAVNGSQLNATHLAIGALDVATDALGAGVASSLGGGAAYDPATGALTAPSYAIGGTTYTSVGGALTNLDGRTTQNTTDIATLGDQIANGGVGLVQQDATSRGLTVGAATDGTSVDFTGTDGARVLTGVGAGEVSATSTDAINGSQLNATNLAVTAVDGAVDTLGAGVASGLGGGAAYDPATGALTAPAYAIGGTTYNDVGGALTNLDGRTTANTTAINNLSAGGGIKYFRANSTLDDASAAGTDSIAAGALANAAGTSSVAVGHEADALSNDSVAIGRAAVAGVAGGNSGETAVGATATATADQASAFGFASQASGIGATALGNAATAAQAGAVALGSNSVTAAAVATASGSIAGTSYSYAGTAPASTVSIGTSGSERTLTNLAAGRVSTTSTDAVNGSQLNATHLAIGALDVATDALGAGVASSLGGGAAYDPATGALTAPSYAIGGTTYTSVGGALTNLDGRTTQNTTDIATLGDQIANGGVGLVQQDATSRGLTVGAATDGTSVDFTGTDGARVLTGIGTGAISATSTDAVNGSQLHAANTSLANALGGGAAVNADGTVSAPVYHINGTDYGNVADAIEHLAVGGVQSVYFHANSVLADSSAQGDDSIAVGPLAVAASNDAIAMGRNAVAGTSGGGAAAVAMGADAVASADGTLALGSSAQATHANSVALGAGSQTTVGAQSGYAAAFVGSSTSSGEVSVGNRTVSGLAAGAAATDAVNVSQLDSGVQQAISIANAYTEARVSQLSGQPAGNVPMLGVNSPDGQVAAATGTDSMAAGSGAKASGTESLALGNDATATAQGSIALGAGSVADRENTVSVGAAGSERAIVHVAAGSADTDAVNVAQLKQVQASAVGYDRSADGSPDYGSLSLGGPGATTTTRVRNVSAGVAPTDAVNVQQLQSGLQDTLVQSRQYTDARLQEVQGDMWTMRKEMRGGTASAMAMAGMPQSSMPGGNMLAVGVGGYQGEVGMAVGLSSMTESGRYIMKANVSTNTAHDFGFAVGAGIQW